MFKEFKLLKNEHLSISIPIILIGLFPIILVSGSAIINFLIIIICFFFIFNKINSKDFKFLKSNYFFYLLFFFLSLIINIFFSKFGTYDFSRQLGFLRYLIFVFAIAFFFNYQNSSYQNLIFKLWFLFFLLVSFDLLFEFSFGKNIFGNISYLEGRLSSFLGDELKIGNYYYGFFLISLCFLTFNKYNSSIVITAIIIFLFISFIIGERANFIKTFIALMIFLIFMNSINFKIKTLIILIISAGILFTVILNQGLKTRVIQIYKPVTELGLLNYIKSSHYGAHYDTAIKIFINYKYFGIGLKQFRNESSKEIYDNNRFNIYNRDNWATHPHQTHFEILSETGLFGYICFILFFVLSLINAIKSYIKNRNVYLLSGIIFIIVSLIPILPSGSFFTTYTATIFWINYSLLIIFDKYEFNKKT